MKKRIVVISVLAVLVALLSVAAFAQDEPVLKQYKVVNENGKEVLVSAEHVKLGDVIEYRATFTNRQKFNLPNVALVIPVPKGTQWVSGSATPEVQQASVDGKSFSALPLRVTRSNGVEEVVPTSAYRALRWIFPVVKPGQTVTAKMRVVVS